MSGETIVMAIRMRRMCIFLTRGLKEALPDVAVSSIYYGKDAIDYHNGYACRAASPLQRICFWT